MGEVGWLDRSDGCNNSDNPGVRAFFSMFISLSSLLFPFCLVVIYL